MEVTVGVVFGLALGVTLGALASRAAGPARGIDLASFAASTVVSLSLLIWVLIR